MLIMYPYEGIPGPHVDAILPALVHQIRPGEYAQCEDPAGCQECAPKLAKRRKWHRATGSERVRLRRELKQAQALDAEETAQRLVVLPPPVDTDEGELPLF